MLRAKDHFFFADLEKDVATQILILGEKYKGRFGQAPNKVLVNPATFPKVEGSTTLDVVPAPYVQPHQIWIGRVS